MHTINFEPMVPVLTTAVLVAEPGPDPRRSPLIQKACVVCPSSLCLNWQREFKQWLGPERINTLVISADTKTQAVAIQNFLDGRKQDVVIISYELYRKHSKALNVKKLDLLICDEGHRLKNSTANKTIMALNVRKCRREPPHMHHDVVLSPSERAEYLFAGRHASAGADYGHASPERLGGILCDVQLRQPVRGQTAPVLTPYIALSPRSLR